MVIYYRILSTLLCVAPGGRWFPTLGKFTMNLIGPKENKGETLGEKFFIAHGSASRSVLCQVLPLRPQHTLPEPWLCSSLLLSTLLLLSLGSTPQAPTPCCSSCFTSPAPSSRRKSMGCSLVTGRYLTQLFTRNGGEERMTVTLHCLPQTGGSVVVNITRYANSPLYAYHCQGQVRNTG